MTTRPTISIKTKSIAALFITILLWSSSLVGIRIGLKSFDAGSLALLRYLTASICMLFFLFKVGKRHKPTLKELGMIFFAGCIGFAIYNICLNQGEVTVDPGTASFILSQIPVVIVILAFIFLQERLNLYGWLGIFISIIGIGLVAFGKGIDGREGMHGIIYLLIATLCHATYTIIHKPFLRKFNPIEFTAYAMWGGTIALLFYVPSLCHEIVKASMSAILAGIYIGIFPAAIGYLTWSYALNHMPASKVGSVLYAQPIFTIIFSWLLLSEIPTRWSFIGGAIALLGAFVVNMSYKTKTSAQIVTE